MVDEGVLISGDNLKNLKVEAKNSEETVSLDINTNENKVLVKADFDETKLITGTNVTIIDGNNEQKSDNNNELESDDNNEQKSSGDNVENQTVTNENQNSKSESQVNNANGNENKLEAYIDKDGDGIYETKLKPSKKTSVKAGDSIGYFIIILMVSLNVIIIIRVKKL